MALRELYADERAIEGLPIRLVIAFIVGVATLSVMLNMISGIGGLAVTELDAKPAPDVVSPGEQSLTITVVDTEGAPVADATVILKGGTATLPGGVHTATTGPNGTVTLSVAPTLAANQVQGTLEIDIKPPSGSQYADEQANTDVLVVSGNSATLLPVDPLLLPATA
ncbi:MAG: carboxypeptidase regulatory-like domain-containing protein [Halobacteriaceae archaeon]